MKNPTTRQFTFIWLYIAFILIGFLIDRNVALGALLVLSIVHVGVEYAWHHQQKNKGITFKFKPKTLFNKQYLDSLLFLSVFGVPILFRLFNHENWNSLEIFYAVGFISMLALGFILKGYEWLVFNESYIIYLSEKSQEIAWEKVHKIEFLDDKMKLFFQEEEPLVIIYKDLIEREGSDVESMVTSKAEFFSFKLVDMRSQQKATKTSPMKGRVREK